MKFDPMTGEPIQEETKEPENRKEKLNSIQ